MKTPLLALLILGFASSAAQAQVSQQWVARYASPTSYSDVPYAMTVDAGGSIYVTGTTGTTSGGHDWTTIKYNPAGVQEWLRTLDGGGNDAAFAITTDAAGNVYVTGHSAGGFYFMTAKYNAAGDRLWVQTFTTIGEGDAGVDLAVDTQGNVYVTGYNMETSLDIITIKYSPGGAELWVRRFDSGNGEDVPAAIACDASGVYVTGRSNCQFTTIKYDFDGVQQWVRTYNGGNGCDSPAAMSLDAAGNIYVTGQSTGLGTNSDYATIKYDAAGAQQWVRRYDGPTTTLASDYDRPAAIALDANGNVFVTGNSSDDFATVKYDGAGTELWVRRYSGPAAGADWATAIAVDASGNSYVTGSSYGGSTTKYDFATLSYDPSGTVRWTERYNGPANDYDQPYAVAVHSSGSVYVSGSSVGVGTSSDYTTIQYAPGAPPSPPATLTFNPPHDAWVTASKPSSNSGARPELRVRGGSQTTRSYLKFDVSGVTGAVQSATLRLRVMDAGPDGGSVFPVSNHFAGTSTSWTESGLTWNNAPPPGGSPLDAAGPVSAGTWVELDVTPAITGNGTFSFALAGASNNVVDYSSSEGANPPQLVVTVAGSAAPLRLESPRIEAAPVAGEIALRANHPNPFVGGTTIAYALPRPMPVRLAIYDITGRKVRTLLNSIQGAGERRVTWDGRDEHGARVGAGIYIYQLEAAATRLTRRMSVLK